MLVDSPTPGMVGIITKMAASQMRAQRAVLKRTVKGWLRTTRRWRLTAMAAMVKLEVRRKVPLRRAHALHHTSPSEFLQRDK